MGKSFEAGMEAGAKPFEEKFKKQADAFEKTADKLDGKLDDIKGVTDTLVDDGLARERKEIFGLNTLFDIKNMENTEKILVVSLLYALAQRFDANDFQKAYIRSVQKYLELKNIQPADTLTGVEGVKDIDSQKAILQVIMEYLFLDGFSFDFLDEEDYEDLFDSFNVNRKGFRDVETAINNIYQAIGADGLAEKYGLVDDVENESDETPVTDLSEKEQQAETLFFNYKIEEALICFEQLCLLNNPRSMYFAAMIYNDGYVNGRTNQEKAKSLFKQGSDLGDSICTLNYANKFLSGDERSKAIAKAFDDVLELAKAGDIMAQYEIAMGFNVGLNGNKDYQMAFFWFEKSKDLWLSQVALGCFYYRGRAVKQDKLIAAKLWKRAAKTGYDKAAYLYANYVSGLVNFKKAIDLVDEDVFANDSSESVDSEEGAVSFNVDIEGQNNIMAKLTAKQLAKIVSKGAAIKAKRNELGYDILKDYFDAEYITYLNIAVSGEHPEAKYLLARELILGFKNVNNMDVNRGIFLLQELAEDGDTRAAKMLKKLDSGEKISYFSFPAPNVNVDMI